VQLEEPFGVLPLNSICESVEANIHQILRDHRPIEEYRDVSS
jgi:predicted membrane chloride channel (bestrophin family)